MPRRSNPLGEIAVTHVILAVKRLMGRRPSSGTIMVSRALAEAGHPEVTLICGADLYYFLFDNTAKRRSGEAHAQETAIIRHPRFDAVPSITWCSRA